MMPSGILINIRINLVTRNTQGKYYLLNIWSMIKIGIRITLRKRDGHILCNVQLLSHMRT